MRKKTQRVFDKKKLREITGIPAKGLSVYEAAFCHPSYRHEGAHVDLESFDRLEFLGDAILNYVICIKIYALFPKASEGELSRLRSILVSRKILCRVARDIRLGKLLRLGKSLKRQPHPPRDKVLADSFEALIAAIFFDAGLSKAEFFILRHFKPYLNAKRLFRLDPNPKSSLQEFCQKHWQILPLYRNEMRDGRVETEISIADRWKVRAHGTTRRQAEEKAARLLLKKMRDTRADQSKKSSSGRK